MRSLLLLLICILFCPSIAVPVTPKPGVLILMVADLKGKPVRRVRINLKEPGNNPHGPSNDDGRIDIDLPPSIKPQKDWVTLQLIGDTYAFLQPWRGLAPVPCFEDEAKCYVEVILMKKGDREALESGKFAVKMAAKFNASLTPQPKSEGSTEGQRQAALAEIAQSVGLKPEEVDLAIREYSKKIDRMVREHGVKAVDPYDKGVIALYERNYPEAEAQLTQSYEMREAAFGKAQSEMVDVALSLGQVLFEQGKYLEATQKFRKADELRNDDSVILNWLGGSLHADGKYPEAEMLYQRALKIREKALGPDHPDTGQSLSNLAMLYQSQGKYREAEPLFQRDLKITEKALGPHHPDTATSLNNLAVLYKSQGKYPEAEPFYQRALKIREKALGSDHPDTGQSLNNLALLYKSQGKYAEAEPLYQRALKIREKALGPDHPDTAISLNNLAGLYKSQGKYAEAEPPYQRALRTFEKALGKEHPNVATVLENYADLLRKMNRAAEAEAMEKRAQEIRAKFKSAPKK